MTPYFFKLAQENENLYHNELLKYGVEHNLAALAAKILASDKPNELLSSEELQVLTEACEHWSTQYLYRNGGMGENRRLSQDFW
ncbi:MULTISPECIES: hypothetical protein [Nostocales]|uniref:Uncharacterized protein n=3 Tax=Nostocales TaxID=1161 RepID=A0A0C1NH99_9CYAN|nr:hypothetical protein [Tolypothrix bouteillei]KAF3890463.1 hypothetical protein DA73_0400037175 [Tolypothrix bouteillei VB521301]